MIGVASDAINKKAPFNILIGAYHFLRDKYY